MPHKKRDLWCLLVSRACFTFLKLRLWSKKKRAAQKTRFMVSVGHKALFHFFRFGRSVSKKRAAQKTRFKVSVGLNTLFHFFEKTAQSQVLKKNHLNGSYRNN